MLGVETEPVTSLGHAEVGALQHEERAQGYEEARYAGPHHQVAVEEADDEAEDEGEHGADDEVDAEPGSRTSR